MDPRVTTYNPLDEIFAADLNAIQDRAAEVAWLNGYMRGGKRLRSNPTTNDSVYVSRILALVLGNKVFSTVAETQVTYAKAESPGWNGSTGNGWWYLYAFNNAGTLDYVFSQTAPDDALMFKSGTTTHRYLGCVYTLSANTIFDFVAVNGVYRWSAKQPVSPSTLSSNTAATITASGRCAPPHARELQCVALVQNSGTGAEDDLIVRNNNTSLSNDEKTVVAAAANTDGVGEFSIITDTSQRFKAYTTPNAINTNIWSIGFSEETP